MKFKSFITIISGLLMVILLLVDLKSGKNSAVDKWTSFGLGMTSVVFISGLVSLIALYRKKSNSDLSR